jgi:hypothetical protein
MDPITATHLVQDRTQDLQRIADQVRQERSLRSKSTAAAAASPPALVRAAERRRAPAAAPATTAGCDLTEPAA